MTINTHILDISDNISLLFNLYLYNDDNYYVFYL